MRVVHVSCFRDPADRDAETLLGEWGTLTGVATAVRRAGAEVSVVQSAAADARVEREGVPFHFVREPRPPGVRLLFRRAAPLPFRASRLIAGLRPDLIHFHGLSFPIQTWVLHRRTRGVPIVLQDHADVPHAGWRGRAQRRAIRGAAAVTFTAAEQGDPFRAAGVLDDSTPVREVCEGSSDLSPGDMSEARRRTGMTGDPAVLSVGDLAQGKDPLTALGVVARASERLPGIQLWCVYRAAPLLEAVRSRVASDPALQDRIHLVGPVESRDMEAWHRSADYFLSASRHEGSGYAAIEAMACGTPPVLSDIPSFRRLTGDGCVGALFVTGGVASGADALARMEREGRAARRGAVRSWFDAELSFNAIGRRLVSIYREVLAR